jgi:hypothetical protein
MAACKDALEVPNRNAPDIVRSYSTPAVLDQLIATGYAQIHTGLFGSSTALDPQLMVTSFENYATVANFGMALREAMPRAQVDNSRNNFTHDEDYRDFSKMAQQARYSANYIQALDALLKGGGTLGNVGTDNTGLNMRARSFAFFENGVSLGNLALAYDSAAITLPTTAPTDIPPMSAHQDVMKAALAELDSALAIGGASNAAPGFPLPANYINLASGTYTQAQYLALIHSYKARFRAGVARTPAERAAVDWAAVVADATAGIQADLVVTISTAAGWPLSWQGSQMFASNSAGWHEVSPMIFGMADTSGGYSAWIAQPLSARAPFLIKTPDKRFPSGETRAAQQASSPTSWNYANYPYMRNRASADPPGDAWGTSYYDFWRFKQIFDTPGTTGPWIEFGKVENDMLAAEGDIRNGDFASAAALINKSRTKAGLAPVLPQQDGGNTGSGCVPRVPTTAGSVTKCGDILEAMKWEKRMEGAFTGYGLWYFDARGWGDLPEGSALEWPVPYQEMDARTLPTYNLGGVGGASSATKGTYGF